MSDLVLLAKAKYKEFTRYVWADEVIWKVDPDRTSTYVVTQHPFVSGYFVSIFAEDTDGWQEDTTLPITEPFKRLGDALAMLKVLDATSNIRWSDDAWEAISPRHWRIMRASPASFFRSYIDIYAAGRHSWDVHVNGSYIATFPSWEEASQAAPMLFQLHKDSQ